MAINKRYSDEDMQKAFKAIDSGHTLSWASMRYGVPKASLRRKYLESKQEKDDEKTDT